MISSFTSSGVQEFAINVRPNLQSLSRRDSLLCYPELELTVTGASSQEPRHLVVRNVASSPIPKAAQQLLFNLPGP